MSVNEKMVAAGLAVFEEYLVWDDYPYTNEQLIGAILRAAMTAYEPPIKTASKAAFSSGFVYFVKCGDYIKIGKASNVKKRVTSIQTSAPNKLELMGHLEGGLRKEREMHRMFADQRKSGEWFNDCPEIRDYIDKHCIKTSNDDFTTANLYKTRTA